MGGRRGWIVFDGDDTLWRTTPLYEAAVAQVAAIVAEHGGDPAAAVGWLAEHDVSQAAAMGYSMHRFPSTLRATAERFAGGGLAAWAALGMGYAVFARRAEPAEGAAALLESLARDWHLALLTAGETSIQQKRVADFGHGGMFAHVRIVPHKDAGAFRRLAADLAMAPAQCWVVGDSLRSDIIPAVRAGFRAIHLACANWKGYEAAGLEPPGGTPSVRTLAEAGRIITDW